MTSPAVAYSYIRFSSTKQEQGDSIRRQTELATKWAEHTGIHMDPAHPHVGSAFRGRNRDLGSLAEFLRLVENGRILPGSYLVVESLDRLTREEIQPALLLILNLLQKGIRVVQLKPVEMVYDSKSDTTPIILMLVELSRGHSESKVKSERVGAAWSQRREKARQGETLTKQLPAWIEEKDGKRLAIPQRAEVVRRIFRLSVEGHGVYAIMAKLSAEKVPPFGPSGRWSRSYVTLILTDRRATGEFQPRVHNGAADGEPIADYFPAVVSAEEFERAVAAMAERRRRPGRIGDRVNVFSGLLREARSGDAYVIQGSSRKASYDVLTHNADSRGPGETYSFPLYVFEAAVLSSLREIDPHDILNGDSGPDEALALAADLARVEGRTAELEAELEQGDVPALARALRRLEANRAELAERLAAARQKAANPLSESWGETQTLLGALEGAHDPKEARLRLRAALRRIVESIRVLVVPRGYERLCAVQIRFAGGERVRNYLILYRRAFGNRVSSRPAEWWCKSFASAGLPDGLDLRKTEHAKRLAAKLEAVVLTTLNPGDE